MSNSITLDRTALLDAIAGPAGIAPAKCSLPILSHLLLSVSGETLSVTGSDLETEITSTTPLPPLEQGQDAWSACVPARTLLQVAKAASGTEITLRMDGEHCAVQAGRSKWRIARLPSAEYPRLDTPTEGLISLPIHGCLIRQALHRTLAAAAKDDVRYYLRGVLLTLTTDGELMCVATDGHRLGKTSIALPPGTPGLPERPVSGIIPRTACIQIQRLVADTDAPVQISIPQDSPHWIELALDDQQLRCKLIDGRYPEWQRVVPSGLQHTARISAADFAGAVRRVALLSHEEYHGLRLTLLPGPTADTSALTISAHNTRQEDATETLGIDYAGPELSMGYRSDYILDALATLDCETAELQMGPNPGDTSSVLVDPARIIEDVQVLMPMRL